ncbi:hypothetical protein ASF69_16690 [Rhizobium sp. Leaf311]|nr:hypothetical protein ASF69_16690 [Rhizobium sp. Leaf311]
MAKRSIAAMARAATFFIGFDSTLLPLNKSDRGVPQPTCQARWRRPDCVALGAATQDLRRLVEAQHWPFAAHQNVTNL